MKWHQLFVKDVRGGYRMPKEMHEVDRELAKHRALVIASPENIPEGGVTQGIYEVRSYGDAEDREYVDEIFVCFGLRVVSEKTLGAPARA